MKARVYHGPYQMCWEDWPETQPGPGEVLVRVRAAGIPATLGQCAQAVKPGGVVVALGGWRSIELQMNQLVCKEFDLRGTFNYTANEFEQACKWLVDGRFDPALLVTHTDPLSEGSDTFAHMAKNNAEGIKFVLTQEAIG